MSKQSTGRGSGSRAPVRSPGSRTDGFAESFFIEIDLGHLSTALVVASVEFVCGVGILLVLSVLETISHETATIWGATILVPLSLTIGCLGVAVGTAGKRVSDRGLAREAVGRAGHPRIVPS